MSGVGGVERERERERQRQRKRKGGRCSGGGTKKKKKREEEGEEREREREREGESVTCTRAPPWQLMQCDQMDEHWRMTEGRTETHRYAHKCINRAHAIFLKINYSLMAT